MKIGFLSDLHITNNTNMMSQAVDSVIQIAQESSIKKLFIAGDISSNHITTLDFIDLLNKEGLETYTVFGNHEYWSICYEDAKELIHDNYINGKSIDVGNSVIIGIDGFFDYSFVLNVDSIYTRHISRDKNILNRGGRQHFDLKRNKVGNSVEDYEQIFDDMENKLIEQLEINKGKNIILITHYVPSEEFIIYNDDKSWVTNNAFMGSQRYRELAEEYKVDKVIFGHTHTAHCKEINGVSYHCSPVGYSNFEYEGTFRDRVKERLLTFDV